MVVSLPSDTADVTTGYVFYVYDDDPEDPRFSFWIETAEAGGMSLFERPPDGAGMWLKPSKDDEHDAVEPSDELRQLVAEFVAGDGVPASRVQQLPAHERHFFEVVHGTIREKPDAIPDPVWDWMEGSVTEVTADAA